MTCLFQILHGSAGTGFLENADRFVCGVLCFTQNIPRFFIRFAQDTVPRLVDFIVFLLQLMPEGFDFFFVIFDFAAFFFNCNAALFQIGNNVFKADVLFVDLLFGSFDDFVGKTELFGNCKGDSCRGFCAYQKMQRR